MTRLFPGNNRPHGQERGGGGGVDARVRFEERDNNPIIEASSLEEPKWVL